eukprot:scaffold134129_cov20-Prasinocladus_malaysianus.AAC.1
MVNSVLQSFKTPRNVYEFWPECILLYATIGNTMSTSIHSLLFLGKSMVFFSDLLFAEISNQRADIIRLLWQHYAGDGADELSKPRGTVSGL